jgi:hypothetical protein
VQSLTLEFALIQGSFIVNEARSDYDGGRFFKEPNMMQILAPKDGNRAIA